MNRLPHLFFLLTGTALLADPSPAPQSTADAATAEAVPILQAGYVDFKTLHYQPGDTLKDLVARSDGGIQLLAQSEETPARPILSALLPGNIVYWRLASFTPEKSWNDLAAQLDQWTGQDAQGIILDLRNNVAPDDLDGAAQVDAFFARDHDSPFVIESSSVPFAPGLSFHPARSFPRPMVVLIDHDSKGAAEALAASLQRQGALLIGQPTPGKVAWFVQKTLSTGQVLRYLGAFVYLPDRTELWNHPVTPDITLTVHDDTEKAAMALIDQGGVMEVIGEADGRHRMSEAALVQGENPEEDAYLATLEKNSPAGRLKVPVIRDTALISALDSLKAIEVSLRPPLPPPQPAPAVQPATSNP